MQQPSQQQPKYRPIMPKTQQPSILHYFKKKNIPKNNQSVIVQQRLELAPIIPKPLPREDSLMLQECNLKESLVPMRGASNKIETGRQGMIDFTCDNNRLSSQEEKENVEHNNKIEPKLKEPMLKDLPSFRKIGNLYLQSGVLSMDAYLDVYEIYRFLTINDCELLREEIDEEIKAPTFDDLMSYLICDKQNKVVTNLLEHLLKYLTESDNVQLSNTAAHMSLFLEDKDKELATMFMTKEFNEISFNDRLAALKHLKNELLDSRLFRKKYPRVNKEVAEIVHQRNVSRMERNKLRDKLSALKEEEQNIESKLVIHEGTLRWVQREIEAREDAESDCVKQLESEMLKSEREVQHFRLKVGKKKREISEAEEELQNFIKKKDVSVFEDEIKRLNRYFRDDETIYLGHDRRMRRYWHIPHIGGLIIQPEMHKNEWEIILDKSEMTRLIDALNIWEPGPERALESTLWKQMHVIHQTFDAANGWLNTITDKKYCNIDFESCDDEVREEIQDLMLGAMDSFEQAMEYRRRRPNTALTEQMLYCGDCKLDTEIPKTRNEYVFTLMQMMSQFKDDFYQKAEGCNLCRRLNDCICRSQWNLDLWQQQLSQYNMSFISLFIWHFSYHLEFLCKCYRQRFGRLEKDETMRKIVEKSSPLSEIQPNIDTGTSSDSETENVRTRRSSRIKKRKQTSTGWKKRLRIGKTRIIHVSSDEESDEELRNLRPRRKTR